MKLDFETIVQIGAISLTTSIAVNFVGTTLGLGLGFSRDELNTGQLSDRHRYGDY